MELTENRRAVAVRTCVMDDTPFHYQATIVGGAPYSEWRMSLRSTLYPWVSFDRFVGTRALQAANQERRDPESILYLIEMTTVFDLHDAVERMLEG